MTNFADIADPLEWYYGSGYKLINPACRILTQNVGYRSTLQASRADDYLFQYTVAKLTNDLHGQVTRGGEKTKTWDWMEIDEESRTILLTKSARDIAESLQTDDSLAPGMTVQQADRQIVKTTHHVAFDRLKSLWDICRRVNAALVSAGGRPPGTCKWVIRGEGTRSITRMEGAGAVFSDTKGTLARSGRDWTAPQFLSTTDGTELANVAQKALIWIIRIKSPDETSGRSGGAYQSEGEVLFPFGTSFRLDGGTKIDETTDLNAFDLSILPPEEQEEAAAFLKTVYEKNKTSGKVTHFLFATETIATTFTM